MSFPARGSGYSRAGPGPSPAEGTSRQQERQPGRGWVVECLRPPRDPGSCPFPRKLGFLPPALAMPGGGVCPQPGRQWASLTGLGPPGDCRPGLPQRGGRGVRLASQIPFSAYGGKRWVPPGLPGEQSGLDFAPCAVAQTSCSVLGDPFTLRSSPIALFS